MRGLEEWRANAAGHPDGLAPPPEPLIIDPGRLRATLAELAAFLKENNSAAVASLERLKPLIGGEKRVRLAAIEELVNDLEFEQALTLFQDLFQNSESAPAANGGTC